MIRTIGLQRSPPPVCSNVITPGAATPRDKGSNINDIAALDKLLTSLLDLQNKRPRSFRSHIGTPRTSRLPPLEELQRNRRSESWPDKIFKDSIVRNVISNLKASKRSSVAEEPFLTPK